MKIPLNWLREYVRFDLSPAALVERLTLSGLEVAATQVFGLPVPEGLRVKLLDQGPIWDADKVLVARVLEISKVPKADKLKFVQLDLGAAEPKTVITGAPNIAVGESGMKVVVGLRGSQYFFQKKAEDPKAIIALEPRKLMGYDNDAMVMSNFELGIADDHDGIIILDESDPAPGTALIDVMGEVVVEVDVLPNMARCLSMIGVAREVAALTGGQVQLPPTAPQSAGAPIAGQVDVVIADAALSARYAAFLIRDVKIGPAPGWMQRRLRYAGQRPINNIVDITNYVMLEWGQPLHAFDYDVLVKRAGGKTPTITVRAAKQGEKLVTLDGVERTLTPDMLIIADGAGPIALAGVMGGLEAEVTPTTTNILLEAASFDFVSIRRTSKALNHITEASTRFSKGIPSAMVPLAGQRAARLMEEYASGAVASGMVDVYPAPRPPMTVRLTTHEIRRILGIDIPAAEVEQLLGALEFGLKREADGWQVTIPDHRLDIQAGAADLIEDLARLYGYDRLPATLLADALPDQRSSLSLRTEERVRDELAKAGLEEAVTYALTAPEREAKVQVATREYVTLLNPLMADRGVMRQMIVPGLLEVAAENLKQGDTVRLFEVGFVYLTQAGQKLPDEPRRLAIVLSGRRRESAWDDVLGEKPDTLDFYDLKGIIETLMATLHLAEVRYQPQKQLEFLHPGRSAVLLLAGQGVGSFGELHPKTALQLGLGERVLLVAELDLEAIIAAVPEKYAYAPVPRFQAAVRDMAIVVGEAVTGEQIEREMREAGAPLLRQIKLFDVYRGDNLPSGSKSLAFTLSYLADDRTLNDKEIDKTHQAIEERLRKSLTASIRGKDNA